MSVKVFYYNLSLLFVDIEGMQSMADLILEEYKTRIVETLRVYTITYRGEPCNVLLHWHKVSFGPHYDNIMGDLMVECLYDDEELIHSYTKQMLYEIDNEMNEKYPHTRRCLIFNLTKMISIPPHKSF